MKSLYRLLFSSLALPALSSVIWAQVDVLTANYDNNRTGANLGEFVLNKSNVNPTRFGKLYSFAVDGDVYAQPLYVRGVNISGGARNVVYVATMSNTVYAFDADATSSTVPLWKHNFGTPVDPSRFDVPGLAFTDILESIGILSTPVIDPATGAIYVVHYTSTDAKNYAYYLHALDLATGAEKFNGPVLIQATITGSGWAGEDHPVNNQLPFLADGHLQRAGLLLLNGNVYVAFGSHGDIGPWHGWLLAYDAATLQQTAVFNTTADNAGGASIWQGGRGLAADAAGNIYAATGNGTWNGLNSWGESVVKLKGSDLSLADFFTPFEWIALNGNDTDLGSSGPMLVPGTNLLCQIGKEGVLFLLDQTSLGHQAPLNNQALQSFQAASPGITDTQAQNSFLVFNTAFWDNIGGQILYMWPYGQPPRSYRMTAGVFKTLPFSVNKTAVNHKPFPGLTVSAFGSLSSSGILWATSADTKMLPGPGTLHAFDALDLTVELWNSGMEPARDAMGNFTKLANPTVANGKVFVPTDSRQVVVYGLLPGVPGVASVVNSASFSFGAVAPGELVTVFGTSVGPATAAFASVDPITRKLPVTLGGVQVTFDDKPAPLLYSGSGQINAVVPFSVAGKSSVEMKVSVAGETYTATLPVSAANPSIFAANSAGSGQGAILNNANLSKNSAANPADRGSVIVIFATGTGATKPASVDGVLAPSANPPLIAQTVTATVGGLDAEVSYQGAAPGLVAGVSQINVTIPAGVTPGPAVPVTITVGKVKSLNTVTVAVK